jgi:hypothetical protein
VAGTPLGKSILADFWEIKRVRTSELFTALDRSDPFNSWPLYGPAVLRCSKNVFLDQRDDQYQSHDGCNDSANLLAIVEGLDETKGTKQRG